MARAKTKTWLPLDRWAEIIGINPFFFNQLESTEFFTGTQCGHVFYQNDWQKADRVSREAVARAIREAEQQIAAYVNYSLLPDWQVDERIQMPRPAVPELFSTGGRNPRGLFQSVSPRFGPWMIEGGTRTKTGIETATVVRSDADGDGYSELVTLTVGTSVTDPDEIKVYFKDKDGADEWEIKPITVSIAANVATITFNSWQIVDPDLQTIFDAASINAATAGSYVTEVDVYRVYNDPSDQLRFLWEGGGYCGTCTACQLNTQTGCFLIRDRRLGIIVPAPATWTASSSTFAGAAWSVCRQPDQIRLWYYAGFQDYNQTQPKTKMANHWELAVAYMAAARLDRDTCGCDSVESQIRHWRSDRAFASQTTGAHQMTQKELGNPFGTKEGELYAWRQANLEDRRVML